MTTISDYSPVKCKDKRCPYNVWLYFGGPFPTQIEIVHWDKVQLGALSSQRKECRVKKKKVSDFRSYKLDKPGGYSWARCPLGRPNSSSSISSSYSDIKLPVDPFAPHAFTATKSKLGAKKSENEMHQVRISSSAL